MLFDVTMITQQENVNLFKLAVAFPENTRKPIGFLMFYEGIEKQHRAVMGWDSSDSNSIFLAFFGSFFNSLFF